MRRLVVLPGLLAAVISAWGWETVAPLPAPRYSGCAVELAGRVWYLGGSEAGGRKTSTVFIYDPQADTWTAGVPMLVARHRFGAAALDGRVYVFGGWGNGGVLLDSAEVFDTLAGAWSPIEPLPTPRASHGGRTANGKIWAIGGRTSTATLGRLDAFDPGTGLWQEYASMPTPRCEAAWSSGSDWVGAIGGTDNLGVTIFDEVEFYDTRDDTWYVHPPMPWPRAAAGSVNTERDFYIVGGWAPGGQPAGNLFQYDAWHRVWRERDTLSIGRAFLAAACVEPWLFAFGGQVAGQPVDLVERIERPLGFSSAPGPTLAPAARTRYARPGDRLDGPVEVFDHLGRRVAHGQTICPELTPGSYFTRRASQPGWTRLVVVR